MGEIADLTAAMANLARWTSTAADEMDRAASSADRLPDTRDGRVVSDDLPPQVARTFSGFGAGSRTITRDAEDAGEAIGELVDDMRAAEQFFGSSSAGKMLQQLLGGFGVGSAEGGTAFSAIDLVERYLQNREELQSGKANAQRTFALKDSLVKQAALFQRFFGSLGQIDQVARELQKFRQRFPNYGSDSVQSSEPSGTLGKPRSTCAPASSSASLDWLRQSGALR